MSLPGVGIWTAAETAQRAFGDADALSVGASLYFIQRPLTVPATSAAVGALTARGVWAGGAVMHRLGLSETLLVFPEHRSFLPPRAERMVKAGF